MGTTATKEERVDGGEPTTDEEGLTETEDNPSRDDESTGPDGGRPSSKPQSLPRRGTSKPIPISARGSPGVDTWCGSHPEGKSYLGKLGSPTAKSAVSSIPPLQRHRPDEAARPAVVVGQKFDGTKPIKRFLFAWTGEANTVAVAGSFNDWTDPIELTRVQPNLYKIEIELEASEHEYKYIIDGKWKHDPLAPVVASGLGSLNNILKLDKSTNVDDAVGEIDSLGGEADPFTSGRLTPPGDYAQTIPSFNEQDAPPLLPPHLKEATLNSEPLFDDPSDLPVPNHVILDHLYAQSVKDNVLVLGATHRYKRKYVTTVIYKPLSGAQR